MMWMKDYTHMIFVIAGKMDKTVTNAAFRHMFMYARKTN